MQWIVGKLKKKSIERDDGLGMLGFILVITICKGVDIHRFLIKKQDL